MIEKTPLLPIFYHDGSSAIDCCILFLSAYRLATMMDIHHHAHKTINFTRKIR